MSRVLPDGASLKQQFAGFLLNFSKLFLELHPKGMITVLLHVPPRIGNAQAFFHSDVGVRVFTWKMGLRQAPISKPDVLWLEDFKVIKLNFLVYGKQLRLS